MTEIIINESELREKALGVVNRLKEVAQNHQRTYPATIEAVLVLSGPGTYYDRLREGQQEWKRWMDRDRIRAGVAVTKEVTAKRLAGLRETTARGHYVS